MSNLTKIGLDFGTYLVKLSPQIKDNSLQWYLSGSLATMVTANASGITEIKLDKENNIIGMSKTKDITDEQREKIQKFSRKLGIDIDVVNVNGDVFNGAPIGNRPHARNVINNVPDVLELMSWGPTMAGSMYIDSLEGDRDIKNHPVAKIETEKGEIYVTAPPEQIAHKLSETILLSSMLFRKKDDSKLISKYEKDIRDFSSMFYGYKDLYEKEEFIDRIYKALDEKDNSIFSVKYAASRNTDAMNAQEIFEKIMIPPIIKDSKQYLSSISDEKSAEEIEEFLNALLSKRREDAEKYVRLPNNEAKSNDDDDERD